MQVSLPTNSSLLEFDRHAFSQKMVTPRAARVHPLLRLRNTATLTPRGTPYTSLACHPILAYLSLMISHCLISMLIDAPTFKDMLDADFLFEVQLPSVEPVETRTREGGRDSEREGG